MRRTRRLSGILCIMLLTALVLPVPSYAYFNRGTVEISTGRSSLSITSGESAAVSVSISPIKEQQLPGCGMAECPQSCGSTGCLNENGECTCAGTTYQTYYSSVKAESSNASVASAVYENGTLTVRGLSAGSAVITLTGSMRQYTDGVKTIDVTVSRAASPSSPSSSGTASNGGSGSGTGSAATQSTAPASSGNAPASAASGESGVSVAPVEGSSGEGVITSPEYGTAQSDPTEDPVSGDLSMDLGEAASEEEEESRVINGRNGEYEIVNLSSMTDVRSYLQAGIDNKRTEIFQKKTGDNIEYSWTFDGTELKEADDLPLLGELSNGAPEDWSSDLKKTEGIFFSVEETKEMPATAQLYVRVSSAFDDGTKVYAYAKDTEGDLHMVDEGLVVENGYVTLSTDRCESLYLTDVSQGSDHHPMMIVLIILVAAAIGAAFITLWISRRKSAS